MIPSTISDAKLADLKDRMNKLGLKDADFVEEFIRGAGPGGQKINKTSVCVLLRHLPSGLWVKCMATRSQSLNRFLARRLLVEKLEAKVLGEKTKKQQEREKIRRQKRKRSKRAKEKMLQTKKHQSEKKKMRRVSWD